MTNSYDSVIDAAARVDYIHEADVQHHLSDAVEQAIGHGIGVKRFIELCAETWAEVLATKAKYDAMTFTDANKGMR